jgi:predicted RNA methylase
VAGKNVVDVGCGVGFLGIACALLGAKKVALTDGNHDVLAMVKQNIGYSTCSPFFGILQKIGKWR